MSQSSQGQPVPSSPQNPQPTKAAHPNPEPKAGDQPEREEAKDPIEFVMVGEDDLGECPFWISFYRPGTMPPMAALSYQGTIAESLAAFGRDGIAYNEAFVTINAERLPPQHLYMFPLERLQKQLTEPEDRLLTNIGSFKPQKVGLYLTNADEKSLTVFDLYRDLVAEVLANPHVKSLYFHSPDHGYHAVLNLISKVKHDLEDQHGPIYIVH